MAIQYIKDIVERFNAVFLVEEKECKLEYTRN